MKPMLHVTPGKATPADPGSPVVGAHFDRSVSAHKPRDNPRSAMLLGLAARDRSLVQLRNQLAGRGHACGSPIEFPDTGGSGAAHWSKCGCHVRHVVPGRHRMIVPLGGNDISFESFGCDLGLGVRGSRVSGPGPGEWTGSSTF